MTLGLTFLVFSVYVAVTASEIEDEALERAIIDEVEGDILICFLDDFATDIRIQHLLSFKAAVTNNTLWPRLKFDEDNIGNNKTGKIVKIGYVVYKYPINDTMKTVTSLMAILKRYPSIVAILGFISDSHDVIQAASFVNAIRMPSFTTSSGSMIDEILNVPNNGFLTRITSARSVQINGTIPSILDKLGVNIVSIFYDKERRLELVTLVREILTRDNRVDVYEDILLKDGEAETLVDHILGKSDPDQSLALKKGRVHTVILLFIGPTLEKIVPYLAKQKDKFPEVLFITDSSGCIRNSQFQNAVETLVSSSNVNMIRLCQTQYREPETERYIDGYKLYSRQPNGSLLSHSKVISNWYTVIKNRSPCVEEENTDWEQDAKCQSVGEACRENIPTSRYNHRIFYTVKKILKSLDSKVTAEQITEISSRTFNELLFKTTRVSDLIQTGFQENDVLPDNATFLRYSNGVMENDYELLFDTKDRSTMTGVWTSSENIGLRLKFEEFMKETKDIITNQNDLYLTCSTNCTEGYRKVVEKQFPNCWKCVACSGNTFSDGNMFICQNCHTNLSEETPLWINNNKTACNQPARSVNIRNVAGKIIWSLASLNLAALTFTIVIYIKYWKSAAIVSSERRLSCVMLAGLLIGNIESMVIASEPTQVICITSQILAQFFGMLTICPLLVKTFKKWLIFHFSLKLGSKIVNYANASATVIQCTVLMIPLFLLLLFGLLLDKSLNLQFTVKYTVESLEDPVAITKSCGPVNFSLALAGIIYQGFLLGVSSALGWECRKLPGNYREMLRIFLTSFVALLLIVVYVPAKRNIAGYAQVSLLAASVTIISMTVNLLIFMPKVYAVLFVTEEKQRQMFSPPISYNSSKNVVDVRTNDCSNIESKL